jgi:hypothetical protein
MAFGKGTTFGEVHGPSLQELFEQIRSLPFKVEHKQTLRISNGDWYIIFTIHDNDALVAKTMPPLSDAAKKLISKPENAAPVRRGRRKNNDS